MQSRKRDHVDDDVQQLNSSLKNARLKSSDSLHMMVSTTNGHPLVQATANYGPSTMPHMHAASGVVDPSMSMAMHQQLLPDYSHPALVPGLLAHGHDGLGNGSMTQVFGNRFTFESEQMAGWYSEHGHALDEMPLHAYPSPEGFPSPELFQGIVNDYIMSLSPKKRDKALIGQKRYDNILLVLRDPKCTTIESAQFRFWAKKMFEMGKTSRGPMGDVVIHEGKPVAVRENLYRVLTEAHGFCQHGGRDKTSAQVRKFWSWVPKELIARFVRNCPTCSVRRNPIGYDLVSHNRSSRPGHATPPSSATSSSPGTLYPSNQATPVHPLSPADSRRTSMISPSGPASISPSGPLGPVVTAMEHSMPPTPTLMTPISVAVSEPHLEAARAAFTYTNNPGMMSAVPNGVPSFHPTGFSYDPSILYHAGEH